MNGLQPSAARVGIKTLALLLLLTGSTAIHAETVYTYVGDTFTMADPPYSTSNRLSGAFSVALPFAPFTANTFADLLDYSFSDGVVTFTPANSIVCDFRLSTDGAGHIISWVVNLREANITAGNPQQLMDSSDGGDQVGIAPADSDPCAMVFPTTVATSNTPGSWTDPLPPGTPTTYSYTGALFTVADPPYTTSDRVTGSFQIAGPLADFQPLTEIGFALDDFSFSDGVQTRTPANSVVCRFEVATDGAGHINAWRISLREPGVMTGSPQQTLDTADGGDVAGSGLAGAGPCDMVILTLAASSDISGTWTDPLPPGSPITYTYTGEPFTTAQPPYTTNDRLTGNIDLAHALPPFLPPTDIVFALQDFSFTDGVDTRTPANSVVCRFEVATDGAGHIVEWIVGLRQSGTNAGDPQHAVDSSMAGDSVGTGLADADACGMISINPGASNTLRGTWTAPLPPATATAYDYVGDPATFAQPPYVLGDQLLGSISVAGRLPANLPLTDLGPALLDFNFGDGQQVRTPADTVVCSFRVATNATGAIVQWQVTLRESGVAPGMTQESADTFNQGTAFGDLFGSGPANADPCGDVVLSPRATVDTPGTWTGEGDGPRAIPTLSESMVALLTVLLAVAALAILRRQT